MDEPIEFQCAGSNSLKCSKHKRKFKGKIGYFLNRNNQFLFNDSCFLLILSYPTIAINKPYTSMYILLICCIKRPRMTIFEFIFIRRKKSDKTHYYSIIIKRNVKLYYKNIFIFYLQIEKEWYAKIRVNVWLTIRTLM